MPPTPPPTDDRVAAMPELLKVSEVARLLRLSKTSIYRLIDSGELTAMRAGRTIRVRADSVRKLIRS